MSLPLAILLSVVTATLLALPSTSDVVVATNEDYPLNLQEKSYLEKLSRRSFTARISDDADVTKPDKMFKILGDEIKRLEKETKRDAQSERSLVLVKRYYDVGKVSQDRCNEEWLQDLLFTVQTSQDNDKSALPVYLRDCAIRQFDLCQPHWDERLAEAIDKLKPGVKESMALLLNHLVAPYPGDVKPEFYTRDSLKEAVKRPSPIALLSFLSHLGKLDGIADENLKSTAVIPFQDFVHIYDESIIDSFCSDICLELQSASEIYKIAFQYDLMKYRKQDDRPSSTSDYLLEWLANKLICCELTTDQKLKEATYEKLTGTQA